MHKLNNFTTTHNFNQSSLSFPLICFKIHLCLKSPNNNFNLYYNSCLILYFRGKTTPNEQYWSIMHKKSDYCPVPWYIRCHTFDKTKAIYWKNETNLQTFGLNVRNFRGFNGNTKRRNTCQIRASTLMITSWGFVSWFPLVHKLDPDSCALIDSC